MAGLVDVLIGNDGSHPKDVAKAYYEMNQRLKEEDAIQENRARLSTPGTTENQKWEGPTPIERWRSQVDAMIQSGNPILQEQGLSMMAAYQTRATQEPAELRDDRSASAKIADDLGLKGRDRVNFILRHSMRAGTQVNIGKSDADFIKPEVLKNLVDADGKAANLPYGTTITEIVGRGYRLAAGSASNEAVNTDSNFALAGEHAKQLLYLIEKGGADISGIGGLITDLRAGADVTSALADLGLNAAGVKSATADLKALNISNSLVNVMGKILSGADIPETQYKRLESELPKAGQPDEVFLINTLKTIENIEYLKTVRGDISGRGDMSDVIEDGEDEEDEEEYDYGDEE